MFREIRRKDRILDTNATNKLIQDNEYGILTTIDENNYPCPTPINYIYMNDSIYFHSAKEGQKIDNIKHNNLVSFCTVGKTELAPSKFTTGYQSAVIYGRAVMVESKEKKTALNGLIVKYAKDYLEESKEYIDKLSDKTLVIKIVVERVTGKANILKDV